MPPIKCPSCEYRNSHTAEICINCGASLALQAPAVETQRLDPAQMREQLALKNKPISSDDRIRHKPAPRPAAQQVDSAQMREQLAPKNKPIPSDDRMPRHKPTPPQETQRLDPAQMREQLAPKNKPTSSDDRMPKHKPVPPQETQQVDSAQMREHPAPKNKPTSSDDRMPKHKPVPPQETQRLDPAQMREHPAPKNKPTSSDDRMPKHKPVPPQETQRLDPAQMREQLAPKNKPSSSDDRMPKHKPVPPQETQRLDPAQMREQLAPKNKPSSNVPNTKPILKEKRISKNRPPSKAEAVETYSEARAEMTSKVEPYPETKAVDPYLSIEPYSEEGSYSKESYSKEIVPYYQNQPESTALVPSISTALEPYRISSMIEQIQPQGILPTLPTFVKEEKNSEPWLTDKLPWGFPRRPPDVAGKIILITQSQELPDYPNVILGLVNMLTELIWMIPNDTMKKEEERLQVTIARIRTNKEDAKQAELKDVRLIGYLRGANLTLGDTVWFWGWHRKGSLLVRKGYNWTSKAIVETHSMGLILPALVVLILLGIAFLIFLVWPSVSSGLSTLFLLTPHHKP